MVLSYEYCHFVITDEAMEVATIPDTRQHELLAEIERRKQVNSFIVFSYQYYFTPEFHFKWNAQPLYNYISLVNLTISLP